MIFLLFPAALSAIFLLKNDAYRAVSDLGAFSVEVIWI